MPETFTIFRADSSKWIGTGHIMRCLALAEELRARGKGSAFFCRDKSGHISERIIDSGFPVILLKSKLAVPEFTGDYQDWGQPETGEDAEEVMTLIKDRGFKPDWLVVDHYGLDCRWEKNFSGKIPNILVIDDLADRAHHCDILLDQNLPIEPLGRYEGLVPNGCEVLLGPTYALLNSIFAKTKRKCGKKPGLVQKVLVSLGGSDPHNITERVADSLLAVAGQQNFCGFHLDVVLGPGFTGCAEKRRKYSSCVGITLHENVKNLAPLMAEADLMIGTAGTTTWERMTLNLPSITLVVADNQRENGEALRRWNYAKVMDCLNGFNDSIFRDLFMGLLSGCEKLAKSPPEVDGLGCSRVVDLMLSGGLKLRRATLLDAKLLYCWANEPGVRKASLNPDPIPWETHVAWLERKLAAPETCVFLVGEDLSGCPVGTARFEENASGWTVNYSVDEIFRGRGWGGKLLRKALDYLRAERNVGLLRAQVKPDNFSSLKIIKSLGFVEKVAFGDCLEYWLETGE